MKSLDQSQILKRLMKAARAAYPNRYIRVQPIPNKVDPGVYQVWTRPLVTKDQSDFVWTLKEEGEPEHLLRNLQSKASGCDQEKEDQRKV